MEPTFPQTELSLSKLALLASEPETGNGKIRELNRELSIIEYQMNIPDSVLEVNRAVSVLRVLCDDCYC